VIEILKKKLCQQDKVRITSFNVEDH